MRLCPFVCPWPACMHRRASGSRVASDMDVAALAKPYHAVMLDEPPMLWYSLRFVVACVQSRRCGRA